MGFFSRASLLLCSLTNLVAAPMDFAKGDAAICAASARGTVNTLAGKPFAGRLTGHVGYRAAAQWMADQCRTLGLKPWPGTQSGLQCYPCSYSVVDRASLQAEVGGKPIAVNGMQDYMPMLYADAGKAKGGVVFAGWGIHAPALGYDDFAGVDVKSKFILCFRGKPNLA